MAYGGNFFLYNDCYVDKDVTKIQKFCQRMLATWMTIMTKDVDCTFCLGWPKCDISWGNKRSRILYKFEDWHAATMSQIVILNKRLNSNFWLSQETWFQWWQKDKTWHCDTKLSKLFTKTYGSCGIYFAGKWWWKDWPTKQKPNQVTINWLCSESEQHCRVLIWVIQYSTETGRNTVH